MQFLEAVKNNAVFFTVWSLLCDYVCACIYIFKAFSDIWKHLLVSTKDSSTVKCKHCSKVFQGHGSTTTLKYHLTRAHKLSFSRISATEPGAEPKEDQPTITAHFPKKKKAEEGEILARLSAVDGIPFHTLARSTEIRKGWESQGYQMPQSRTGVCKAVMEFGGGAKGSLKEELRQRRDNNERFSITFDEWTSQRNRRYLALNLHASSGKVFGLGTVRVNGSLPAERALQTVTDKLQEFGLSLSRDIVGMTTDGAAVMKKIGRLAEVEHQLCHAHGIHLSVCDVLYCKGANMEKDEDDDVEDQEEEEEEEEESEEEDEDESRTWTEGSLLEVVPDFQGSIRKVRKIVLLFRRSPLKNDLLMEVCQKEYGKSLVLLRDTRTRWNSMLKMLQRFLEIRAAVAKALVDLKQVDLFPEEEELEKLQELVNALEVLESGSVALGRQDMDLKQAEIVFNFMLSNLQQQATGIR